MHRSLILAVLLATTGVQAARAQDATGGLTIQLSGLQPHGAIMVQLFDSEAGYRAGEAVGGSRIDVDADADEITFADLAPGQYAFRMFHDLNGDGRMNTNPFGIPIEPFAFSNNARGSFGPASWDQAAFTLNAGENVQQISLGGAQ
jgi:uncharacterized protein (DUF2141 family)